MVANRNLARLRINPPSAPINPPIKTMELLADSFRRLRRSAPKDLSEWIEKVSDATENEDLQEISAMPLADDPKRTWFSDQERAGTFQRIQYLSRKLRSSLRESWYVDAANDVANFSDSFAQQVANQEPYELVRCVEHAQYRLAVLLGTFGKYGKRLAVNPNGWRWIQDNERPFYAQCVEVSEKFRTLEKPIYVLLCETYWPTIDPTWASSVDHHARKAAKCVREINTDFFPEGFPMAPWFLRHLERLAAKVTDVSGDEAREKATAAYLLMLRLERFYHRNMARHWHQIADSGCTEVIEKKRRAIFQSLWIDPEKRQRVSRGGAESDTDIEDRAARAGNRRAPQSALVGEKFSKDQRQEIIERVKARQAESTPEPSGDWSVVSFWDQGRYGHVWSEQAWLVLCRDRKNQADRQGCVLIAGRMIKVDGEIGGPRTKSGKIIGQTSAGSPQKKKQRPRAPSLNEVRLWRHLLDRGYIGQSAKEIAMATGLDKKWVANQLAKWSSCWVVSGHKGYQITEEGAKHGAKRLGMVDKSI